MSEVKRFAPTLAQEKNTIKKKKMNHIHKHKCLHMQNQHNATHLVKKIQEVPGPVWCHHDLGWTTRVYFLLQTFFFRWMVSYRCRSNYENHWPWNRHHVYVCVSKWEYMSVLCVYIILSKIFSFKLALLLKIRDNIKVLRRVGNNRN